MNSMTLLMGRVLKTAQFPLDRHAAARVFVWLIALLAGASDALGADEFRLGWRWSNPFPHGNNIYDLALGVGGDVQVADRGQIYVRTNEFSWVPVPSGVEQSLRGVAHFGDQIVITGESGTILRGTVTEGFVPAVLNPATEDWLEAVAASPSVAIAVGDNAAIYTSADGAQWQRVANLPFTDWLRGVAYDDGTFVVVGENGLIATSADGRQWRRRTSGVTTHLNRVASRSGVFHAVGEGGVSLVGRNGGASWNKEAVGSTNSLFAATANDTQRVVAGDAALRMKTGNNGAWLDQLGDGSPWPAPAWTYFAAAWNGEAFEVAGRTGMMVEGFRSEDGTGTLWVPADESPRHWLWEVARIGDQYLAVGDRATVMTSPNGVDWFEEMVPSTLTNAVFLGVGGSTNLLVAVGDSGSLMVSRSSLTNVVTTNEVVSFVNCLPVTNSVPVTHLINLLGLVWEPVSPAPTANTLQGVAERAGLIVVVGDAGTVLTTGDGWDWALVTIPGQPNLSSVAAAEAGFVATGAAGAIFSSPDGASWSARVSGTANWIYRVRHLGGQFVAVGQNGTLLTSPDAAVWTPRASGSSAWLTDVTFTGSRYFATGTQGTVLTSLDAHVWEPVPVVTGKSLYGAASAGGQLVVVGVEGVILRALTDPMAPVNITQFSQQECPEAGLSRLTFLGAVEQRFRLEYSDDLEHWNIIREFELLESRLPFEYASEARPVTGYRFFRTSLLGP